MSQQSHDIVEPSARSNRRNLMVAGTALIAIGLLAFAAQFMEFANVGLLFLPTLGIIFLVWGIIVRHVGPMIPGGILTGIGAGVILMEQTAALPGEASDAGIFLITFGAGCALITLLSALFTAKTQWWPLIPGAIIAAVGAALLAGDAGLRLLEFAGDLWPLALIAVGVIIVLRAARAAR
jgi:hypothetical protein